MAHGRGINLVTMHLQLETDRLILRPLELADAAVLYQLDTDPEVYRYLPKPDIESPADTEKIIASILDQYEAHGAGRLAMVLKEDQQLIGWCGLKWYDGPMNGVTDFYEIGYRISPKYWGKGLATEAARAVISDAFETTGIRSIYAYVDHENKASIRVLEKLGFRFIKLFYDEGDLCSWHQLDRADFPD